MNSLCIPRAMTYSKASDVESVFNRLFGKTVVSQIDERSTVDHSGLPFKLFYVHFIQSEEMSPAMRTFNEKLERDGVVHVMTGNGKWFWKVYRNKSSPAPTPVPVEPRIMTEEDEKLYLQATPKTQVAAPTAFTEEELDILDEAVQNTLTYAEQAELNALDDEELEEIEDEYSAAECHLEQLELMAIADQMAKE